MACKVCINNKLTTLLYEMSFSFDPSYPNSITREITSLTIQEESIEKFIEIMNEKCTLCDRSGELLEYINDYAKAREQIGKMAEEYGENERYDFANKIFDKILEIVRS